jgi:transposase
VRDDRHGVRFNPAQAEAVIVGKSEMRDLVLELTNKGMTTWEVAQQLSRSTTTIQQYKTELRRDGLLPPYASAPHQDKVLAMARDGRTR